MIDTLRAPLRLSHQMLAAAATLLAVTLYCLAYNQLQDSAESPVDAAGWALTNVLPWLAAFEAAKRSRRLGGKLLALAAGLAASLGLGLLLGDSGAIGFELVRRLPGLLITASLLATLELMAKQRPAAAARKSRDLPMPLEQIEWVGAAGNYVELHGAGRTILHRAPLSSVERQLSRHGFVRVHRSTLVRRDRIARVRPLDIVLADGTSLKTGKCYRASL